MDSGGISDFLGQIPVGLILLFCGSGVLLLITMGYMVNSRSRRARKAVPPVSRYNDAYDDGADDLPDLDVLASSEVASPAPTPATPAAPPRPSGTFSIFLAEGETVDVVEVLSVVRDVADGSLIIRIADKAYRNPPAVADAEFKRRFHNTLRDLNDAQRPVDSTRAPAPAAPAAEPDEPPAAAAPEAAAPAAATPPVEMPSAPPLSAYEPAPGDLPKFKMPEGPPIKPKRGQRPAAEPIPEINIAGAIEAFLQHKLTKLPQYSSRSIHVRPAVHGGVQIEVDGVYFESVSEIEDAAVRQFLTSTIEEWQSRQ